MKKVTTLLLVITLSLATTACSSTDTPASSSAPQIMQEESAMSFPVVSTPDVSISNASTPVVFPAGEGDLGDYHVKVLGAHIEDDSDGNPAIIIDYEWTNNSEDTTSAFAAISERAFQDGIQMELASVTWGDTYDGGSNLTEIRPGATYTVQAAFSLTSNSIVEFELTEFISLSDDCVSMDFDPTALK